MINIMSVPNDQPNPLGHIRFPNIDVSRFCKSIEQATKMNSSMIEKLAAYTPPQFDYGQLARLSDGLLETMRNSQEQANRFNEILAGSTRGIEAALKAIHTVVDGSDFQRAIAQACSVTERISDIVLQMPTITDTFSQIQDRIIFKDLILGNSFMPPAGEYRHLDPPLPLEQIVFEDITLNPVEFARGTSDTTPSSVCEQEAIPSPRTDSAEKTISAPFFLQHVIVRDGAEILEGLPEGAELIDEAIALYAPHKSGLLILVQSGHWIKEKDGVTPQSIEIVQYLRRIGKRTGEPWANATELAKNLAPDAQNIATGRRSIANRMSRLQSICKDYKCKPLFLKTGNLWRINTDLKYWDSVGFMPSYHNKKGH
jgi:hypothetical protein